MFFEHIYLGDNDFYPYNPYKHGFFYKPGTIKWNGELVSTEELPEENLPEGLKELFSDYYSDIKKTSKGN
ncbi:hypothetical protein ES705_09909 [subsurface metagenome]